MGRVNSQVSYLVVNSEELSAEFGQLEKSRLAEKIEDLVLELKRALALETKSGRANASFAEIAKSLYSARRLVDAAFEHEGFSTSPGWDVMLDLYQAETAGRVISVSSACIGAACPPTTGLRWIQAIESMGLIERVSDPTDRRRSFLRLTQKGRAATEQALEQYRGI